MSIDHILVPRVAIPTDKVLSFELYVKVGERFVKVANRDEKIDPERIDRYLSHERDVLYIDRKSLERFMDEKFGTMFELISNVLAPIEKRFLMFIRCLELGFVDLKVVGMTADKFMRLQLLVDRCYEFFSKRELRLILLREVHRNVDQMMTRRALFGASLALTLVMEQSDCPSAAFQSMFSGALFRDITLMNAEGQDDLHLGTVQMDEAQILEWRNHPTKASEALQKFIAVDDIMRATIEQHHELPRGDGFPRGLKRAETYQPAQYLSLADYTITELEKFYRANGKTAKAPEVLEHLQKIMPEENKKNLPLLLRVLMPTLA